MENSFDIRAVTWDDNPKRIKLIKKVTDLLFEKIDFDKNHKILDYGCGTGLLGYQLTEKVGHVTFCDTSDGMLEQVKKKKEFFGYQNVSIVKADFLKNEISGKFDFIFSMLVLHHVEDIRGLLGKFHNYLNEGGVFCWIDLDKEDGSFHSDDSIPHFGFEKEDTILLLKSSGFELTYYSNELVIGKEIKGEFFEYPLFVLMAKKSKIVG